MSSSPLNTDVVERLLNDARNGSLSARSQLVEMGRHYVRQVLGKEGNPIHQALADASDLSQDVSLKAYLHFSQFAGTSAGEFFNWMKQIALNCWRDSRDYWTAGCRDIRLEVRPDDSEAHANRVAQVPDSGPSPSRELAGKEMSDVVNQAIDELPDDYRQVIRLRLWENRPFSEISQEMSRSEDAVRKLFARALERLQDRLRPSS